MDKAKRKRLETAGWKVGSVSDFLEMTQEETAFVELKVSLAKALKNFRTRRKLTQSQLGKLLGSSQSRVAKMEGGDRSVSLDLLVRSLLAIGATRHDLARVIVTTGKRAA